MAKVIKTLLDSYYKNLNLLDKKQPLVLIEKEALEKIFQHARSSSKEVAGYLIGYPIIDSETSLRITYISDIVPGICESNKVSVQIKPETALELEKVRGDRILVGWYHSHPGFSAFFSGTDIQTHQSVYPEEWHVGIVVDPTKDDVKFYGWSHDKKIIELKQNFITTRKLKLKNEYSFKNFLNEALNLIQETRELPDKIVFSRVRTLSEGFLIGSLLKVNGKLMIIVDDLVPHEFKILNLLKDVPPQNTIGFAFKTPRIPKTLLKFLIKRTKNEVLLIVFKDFVAVSENGKLKKFDKNKIIFDNE